MGESVSGNSANRYAPPNPFGVNQKYWERIQGMRLMDDTLMTAALDGNIPATQLILRVILEKDDLEITDVKSQVEYKNLYGHSLRLDVAATDSEENQYDIEIQRARSGAKPERARYHSALMDAHSLKADEDFDKLPTTFVVFITEKDYWKKGFPLYHFDRIMRESGDDFGDRAHIIYANGEYSGEDSVGLLMKDFRESDPERIYFPELAERVTALKNSEDEVKKMCQAMEITYQEGREEGRAEGREEGLEEGRKEGFAEGEKQGIDKGEKRGIDKGIVNSIRNLMESTHWALDQCMDMLKVPDDQREGYAKLLGHPN